MIRNLNILTLGLFLLNFTPAFTTDAVTSTPLLFKTTSGNTVIEVNSTMTNSDLYTTASQVLGSPVRLLVAAGQAIPNDDELVNFSSLYDIGRINVAYGKPPAKVLPSENNNISMGGAGGNDDGDVANNAAVIQAYNNALSQYKSLATTAAGLEELQTKLASLTTQLNNLADSIRAADESDATNLDELKAQYEEILADKAATADAINGVDDPMDA